MSTIGAQRPMAIKSSCYPDKIYKSLPEFKLFGTQEWDDHSTIVLDDYIELKCRSVRILCTTSVLVLLVLRLCGISKILWQLKLFRLWYTFFVIWIIHTFKSLK